MTPFACDLLAMLGAVARRHRRRIVSQGRAERCNGAACVATAGRDRYRRLRYTQSGLTVSTAVPIDSAQ